MLLSLDQMCQSIVLRRKNVITDKVAVLVAKGAQHVSEVARQALEEAVEASQVFKLFLVVVCTRQCNVIAAWIDGNVIVLDINILLQ